MLINSSYNIANKAIINIVRPSSLSGWQNQNKNTISNILARDVPRAVFVSIYVLIGVSVLVTVKIYTEEKVGDEKNFNIKIREFRGEEGSIDGNRGNVLPAGHIGNTYITHTHVSTRVKLCYLYNYKPYTWYMVRIW